MKSKAGKGLAGDGFWCQEKKTQSRLPKRPTTMALVLFEARLEMALNEESRKEQKGNFRKEAAMEDKQG